MAIGAVLLLLGTVVLSKADEDHVSGASFGRLPSLDSSKLEEVYHENWQSKAMSDEKNGIVVEIIEQTSDRQSGGTWENTSGNITEAKTQWIEDISTASVEGHDKIERIRIRKDARTLRYLIGTSKAPFLPRYIALREMYEVPFSQKERLALIELGSRDVKSAIRCMAILKAGDFKPERNAIPILTRALTDPCLDVAVHACAPLIRYFDLRDEKSGELLICGRTYEGAPVGYYMMQMDTVLKVATKLNVLDPTLMTNRDLAIIGARRYPSTTWWKQAYGKDWKLERDDFLESLKEQGKEGAEQAPEHDRLPAAR